MLDAGVSEGQGELSWARYAVLPYIAYYSLYCDDVVLRFWTCQTYIFHLTERDDSSIRVQANGSLCFLGTNGKSVLNVAELGVSNEYWNLVVNWSLRDGVLLIN